MYPNLKYYTLNQNFFSKIYLKSGTRPLIYINNKYSITPVTFNLKYSHPLSKPTEICIFEYESLYPAIKIPPHEWKVQVK